MMNYLSLQKNMLLIFLIALCIDFNKVRSQEETCQILPDNTKFCGSFFKINEETLKNQESSNKGNNLKYEDVFMRQGHERQEYLDSLTRNLNYTDYFDVKLTKEEIEFLKKEKLVYFPPNKFKKYNQGNFLQFYRAAYENKFPVFFTVDSMLYPFNENKRNILYTVLDKILHPTLVNFFQNVTTYIRNLRDNQISAQSKSDPHLDSEIFIRLNDTLLMQAQIYYGSGHEFLIDKLRPNKEPYKYGKDVYPYIQGLTTLAKYYSFNEFVVMSKIVKYDTSSLIPNGFWMEKQERSNIYTMLKWYQLARFDLKEDLHTIYFLAKLINDSGMKKLFKEIRENYSYFIGEDRNSPNFIEIYELGQSLNFGNVYELTDQQSEELYKKIKEIANEGLYSPDIKILNDQILYSREQLMRFRYEKEDSTSLFNYKYSLESWVINKITDYRSNKQRLLVSAIEMIDAMHHANRYREVIFNRYQGKKSHPDELLVRLRDKIDVKENFEKAKYSIKKSMNNNPDYWRKNLENHFHLLLYKSTRKPKKSEDPLYKTEKYKEKSFYTAYGSYVHSKHEMNLMTIDFPYKKNSSAIGEIPDVVFEANLEFYNELNNIWKNFREKVLKAFQISEEFLEKNKYEILKTRLTNSFNEFQDAIDVCIKYIQLQESGESDEEFKKLVKKLIYRDVETGTWLGWYARLYKKENYKRIFSYDVWVQNMFTARENDRINFPGAFIFNVMNFPYIGYVVIHDKVENVDKLLLYTSYDAREYIKEKRDKISFEDISEDIIDRK